MTFFLFNLLNGLQLSMLIFLMAIGLTVIFGLMDILNLAHGAFYMAGAYFGYVVFQGTGSFWIALAVAPLLPLVRTCRPAPTWSPTATWTAAPWQ